MILRIRPQAANELRAAAAWYAKERLELRGQFLDAMDATLQRVLAAPSSFREDLDVPGVRTARLQRFPYRVVFLVKGDAVIVLAFAHARRRPG